MEPDNLMDGYLNKNRNEKTNQYSDFFVRMMNLLPRKWKAK